MDWSEIRPPRGASKSADRAVHTRQKSRELHGCDHCLNSQKGPSTTNPENQRDACQTDSGRNADRPERQHSCILRQFGTAHFPTVIPPKHEMYFGADYCRPRNQEGDLPWTPSAATSVRPGGAVASTRACTDHAVQQNSVVVQWAEGVWLLPTLRRNRTTPGQHSPAPFRPRSNPDFGSSHTVYKTTP